MPCSDDPKDMIENIRLFKSLNFIFRWLKSRRIRGKANYPMIWFSSRLIRQLDKYLSTPATLVSQLPSYSIFFFALDFMFLHHSHSGTQPQFHSDWSSHYFLTFLPPHVCKNGSFSLRSLSPPFRCLNPADSWNPDPQLGFSSDLKCPSPPCSLHFSNGLTPLNIREITQRFFSLSSQRIIICFFKAGMMLWFSGFP